MAKLIYSAERSFGSGVVHLRYGLPGVRA